MSGTDAYWSAKLALEIFGLGFITGALAGGVLVLKVLTHNDKKGHKH